VVKDGGREIVMLCQDQSVLQRGRGGQYSTGRLESLRDVVGNEWLVLNDEDMAPL